MRITQRNLIFNYIPSAQVQFTDVIKPFYSDRHQVIKKAQLRVKGSATPD